MTAHSAFLQQYRNAVIAESVQDLLVDVHLPVHVHRLRGEVVKQRVLRDRVLKPETKTLVSIFFFGGGAKLFVLYSDIIYLILCSLFKIEKVFLNS
jgi:hypothetical protein